MFRRTTKDEVLEIRQKVVRINSELCEIRQDYINKFAGKQNDEATEKMFNETLDRMNDTIARGEALILKASV